MTQCDNVDLILSNIKAIRCEYALFWKAWNTKCLICVPYAYERESNWIQQTFCLFQYHRLWKEGRI